MLDVRVTLSRGTFKLDAEIRDEGFICLSGKNGSGKTTLLEIIAGKVRPDAGAVKIGDDDVTGKPPEARGVVMVSPESLLPHLSVEKHLRWGILARGQVVNEERILAVREKLGIGYTGRVDELSLGMRERVSLATALLSRPRAILVDEAFANIDNRKAFISDYRELCKEEEVDLLHTTQQEVEDVPSDHRYRMDSGKSARMF